MRGISAICFIRASFAHVSVVSATVFFVLFASFVRVSIVRAVAHTYSMLTLLTLTRVPCTQYSETKHRGERETKLEGNLVKEVNQISDNHGQRSNFIQRDERMPFT